MNTPHRNTWIIKCSSDVITQIRSKPVMGTQSVKISYSMGYANMEIIKMLIITNGIRISRNKIKPITKRDKVVIIKLIHIPKICRNKFSLKISQIRSVAIAQMILIKNHST